MLEFENHTECECREINHRPRTLHRLPSPFPSNFDEQETKDTGSLIPPQDHLKESQVSSTPSSTETSLETFHQTTSQKSTSVSDPQVMSNTIEESQSQQEKEDYCIHAKCPNPFIPKLESVFPLKCYCDCKPGIDLACIRIKKGLDRLDSENSRCVRKHDCLRHRCEYSSEFYLNNGSCPKKESQQYPWGSDILYNHKFERD